VNRLLQGCQFEDRFGQPQAAIAGESFCIQQWDACSNSAHGLLVRCLSNCGKCQVDATLAVVADCHADIDRVWGGVPASDLVIAECSMGSPCTEQQQGIASACMANCNACDFENTGSELGMCTEQRHGSAAEFITQTCHQDDVADANNLDQITSLMAPPRCTMLQAAVMTQCDFDCDECDVHSVRDVIGDCLMETGEPAREAMVSYSSIERVGTRCLEVCRLSVLLLAQAAANPTN
jgi:hypothetical protein